MLRPSVAYDGTSRIQFLIAIALSIFVPACVGSCRGKDDTIPVAPREVDDAFGSVRQRWFQPQATWPRARPVVVGSVVVFGTGDQRLIARDRQTGIARWSTRVSSYFPDDTAPISGLDLVSSDGVVAAALTRNVVGVDVASGQELWTYVPPPDTTASPQPGPGAVVVSGLVADGGVLYVPAWGASVTALDIRTGQPRWVWRPSPAPQFRSGAQGASLSGDTLFVNVWNALNAQFTQSEAWLVALDRRSGRELWRVVFPSYSFGTIVRGRPALWRNLVVVASEGGFLFAIDRTTQAIVWRHTPTVKHTTDAGPVIYGDVTYADGGEDSVLALNAADGKVLWRAYILTLATSDLLVTERRVYVNTDGFLNILDRATGRFLFRRVMPNAKGSASLFATPAVAADQEIYITVAGGAWSFLEP